MPDDLTLAREAKEFDRRFPIGSWVRYRGPGELMYARTRSLAYVGESGRLLVDLAWEGESYAVECDHVHGLNDADLEEAGQQGLFDPPPPAA